MTACGHRPACLSALADAFLPWLCSSTAHVLLLAGLAVGYELTREGTRGGVPAPGGIEAVFLTSGGDGIHDSDAADLADVDSEHEGETPLQRFLADNTADGAANGAALDTPLLQTLGDDSSTIELAQATVPPAQSAPRARRQDDRTQLAQAVDGDGKTVRSSGSGGLPNGYARTGVFGVTGEGRKFVYVFDRSGSMDGHGGAPLSAAKSELIGSLHDLDQTHQFQIIFYNERPRVFSPTGVAGRLVFGTDQNKTLAEKFVGGITADGATRHEEALAMALKMVPDVIFFLTDADEPRMTADQLARIARLNQGTQINTVEFGYGVPLDDDNFLVKLARQNAGKHVYVDVSKLASPANQRKAAPVR